MTNDSPIISFLKSTIEPVIISRETLSITALSKIMSSLLALSSKLKLYLNPEQPPPFTEILKNFFNLSSLIIFSICTLARLVNSIFFFIISYYVVYILKSNYAKK